MRLQASWASYIDGQNLNDCTGSDYIESSSMHPWTYVYFKSMMLKEWSIHWFSMLIQSFDQLKCISDQQVWSELNALQANHTFRAVSRNLGNRFFIWVVENETCITARCLWWSWPFQPLDSANRTRLSVCTFRPEYPLSHKQSSNFAIFKRATNRRIIGDSLQGLRGLRIRYYIVALLKTITHQ